MFTIYRALDPKSDVDRLYIPTKEGGGGLISIEDCFELGIRGSEVYVPESEERFIQAARDKIYSLETASFEEIKEREKIRRLGGESSTWSVFEAD